MAVVLREYGYYPFGMLEPGREYAKGKGYRYGFNGKEKSDEVNGDGVDYDYGARVYDARTGRFLSVDPIEKKYPELTPYQFGSNTPIEAVDQDGEEARSSAFFGINVKINLFSIKNKDIVNSIPIGATPDKSPRPFYFTNYQVALFASVPINNGASNVGGNFHIKDRQIVASAIFNVSGTTSYNSSTGQLSFSNNGIAPGSASISLPGNLGQPVSGKTFGLTAIGSVNLSNGKVGFGVDNVDLTKGFQNTSNITPTKKTIAGEGVESFTGAFNKYAYAEGKLLKFNVFGGIGDLPDFNLISVPKIDVRKNPFYLRDNVSEFLKTPLKLDILGKSISIQPKTVVKLAVDAAKSAAKE